MNSYVEKNHKNKSSRSASAAHQQQSTGNSGLPVRDNRPEAVVQRKLQQLESNSSLKKQQAGVRSMMNNSPRAHAPGYVIQRQWMGRIEYGASDNDFSIPNMGVLNAKLNLNIDEPLATSFFSDNEVMIIANNRLYTLIFNNTIRHDISKTTLQREIQTALTGHCVGEAGKISAKIKDLEQRALELGSVLYQGTHPTMTHTDPETKAIYIQEGLSSKQILIDYAYELQNVINVDSHYSKIQESASSGGISDPDEYATKMLDVEAEALITAAEVASEIEFTGSTSKVINDLFAQFKEGNLDKNVLLQEVIKLTELATVEDIPAREWYKNQFKEISKQ